MINAQMIALVRIVLKLKHSVVSGAEMPSNIFACGRLMTRLTWRLSSLHTMTVTTIYISLCLIIYLIKVLQMYIKTCESKFIDSCCFLSMSLSKFSDTFSLPDVMKGTFPHCFNTPNNYGYVGLLPGMLYYDPDGFKESAHSKLLRWHGEHSNVEFIFDSKIHEYCMADVALLKSGCTKFRALFLADTEIDHFRSCRIVGACMHVFKDQMRSKKTFNPQGWLSFTEVLKEMHVPNHLIGNPRRLNITTGSNVGENGSRLHHTHRKKGGGYRDLCKWKTCITIHRIPEVLEVLND